ncbi:Mitochondrial import inner membrane translocase subunit tim8 [Steccherinum ochraceum]|uniref:Mitochondrial import inner membrane translocase subunit n=1 Tax=Steccherinum ochraceum TaxID=92696 RepID=A0A4R0RJG7_9APHY|nr:Mitochondrial import inner membrane translocase subunit tim8 [Steccherinum ochraceum]
MAESVPNFNQFDDATKKELSAFVENEQAQQRLNSSIHTFTDMCWDKCVTGLPSTSFSRSETSCLSNCVNRFLDSSLFLVKKIEDQREAAARS